MNSITKNNVSKRTISVSKCSTTKNRKFVSGIKSNGVQKRNVENVGLEYLRNDLNLVFYSIVENSKEGVLLIDDQFNIKYTNYKFCKIFDLKQSATLNKNLKNYLSDDIQKKLFVGFKKLLRSNSNKLKFEITVQKNNNRVSFLKINVIKIQEVSGKELTLFQIEDITKQKIANDELTIAKNTAENADKLKSIFLAQMSHEIRTPINAMVSFSSLLKDELKTEISEDLTTAFDVIDKAGKRIIRTVDLLLNLSEIQANSYEGIFKKIDLSCDVLPSIISEHKTLAKKKGLTLEIALNAKNCEVVADVYTVNQIFTHLLDNAIKYTNKGGISIYVYNSVEGDVVVKIFDTGIGISEEYLPRIFNSFTQEEQGYTRKYEGNGIGLSLVKKYCELNDIEISVESLKGKGTIFTLTF